MLMASQGFRGNRERGAARAFMRQDDVSCQSSICPVTRLERPRGARRVCVSGTAASDGARGRRPVAGAVVPGSRSEEHTSELQSHSDLVCRLLLEKKKKNT